MGLLSRLGGVFGKRAAPAPVQTMPDLPVFRIPPSRDFSSAELRGLGHGPSPRYGSGQHRMDMGRPNPMAEMQEMQAMHNRLQQLKQERAYAQTMEEANEIDMEMSILRRALGIQTWDAV